jgi:hypothetical protein
VTFVLVVALLGPVGLVGVHVSSHVGVSFNVLRPLDRGAKRRTFHGSLLIEAPVTLVVHLPVDWKVKA